MHEGLHKIVSDEETIVAISTPLGHGGIGVIRISGPECLNIAHRFFRPHQPTSVLRHRVALIGLWNNVEGAPIDEVVVTLFQRPRSYTGEEVLEISGHGNPIVLRGIVESAQFMGARLAAPGEFTLRAVANGKMDLIQAEAVREFIEAQTDRQARTALRQMEGSLSKHVAPIKDRLVDAIARLEAGIDFAEDDVAVPENTAMVSNVRTLRLELERLKETFGYGQIVSKGLRVAIVGKPNVGKSSLFNCLVSADRAIVTDIPGTTRDVVTESISMDGIPLCFFDTAGIRDTIDRVESLGVTRTFEALAEADLALVVLDGSCAMTGEDRVVLDKAKRIPYLIVVNKYDLTHIIDLSGVQGSKPIFVSAKTRLGETELKAALHAFLLSRKTTLDEDLILTNARQYNAVTSATAALSNAEEGLTRCVPHEMVLLDLYGALSDLNELTGDVVTDDILDRIFSTFCVGK